MSMLVANAVKGIPAGKQLTKAQIIGLVQHDNPSIPDEKIYASDSAGELKDGKLIGRVGRDGKRHQYAPLCLQYVTRGVFKTVPESAWKLDTPSNAGTGVTSDPKAVADSVAALIALRDQANPAPANVVAAQRAK